MNITSSTVGPEVSEPELAGLEMAPSLVRPQRGKVPGRVRVLVLEGDLLIIADVRPPRLS
jgi:hypothetical protein